MSEQIIVRDLRRQELGVDFRDRSTESISISRDAGRHDHTALPHRVSRQHVRMPGGRHQDRADRRALRAGLRADFGAVAGGVSR